uniref:Uncharacterized protein n=1 Tax=Setaria viridis TaxID=4556 RepID=A0A4V6D079_SETVI|nr:hypothetical protein SEVIR_9G002950v2 [Setaria viridis]
MHLIVILARFVTCSHPWLSSACLLVLDQHPQQ